MNASGGNTRKYWSNKVAITGDTKAKACGNQKFPFFPSYFSSSLTFWMEDKQQTPSEERRRAPEQSNCLSFQFLSLLKFILVCFFFFVCVCVPHFLSPPHVRRLKLFCEEKKNKRTEMTLHFTETPSFSAARKSIGQRGRQTSFPFFFGSYWLTLLTLGWTN